MAAIDDTVEVEERSADIVPLPVQITKKILGGEDEAGIKRSNLIELSEHMARGFTDVGALEPPLDPLSLTRLVGMSQTMGGLLNAMAANVHGFGYYFEPLIDLEASDATDRVKAAMLLEAELKAEREAGEGDEPGDIDEPSDDEVKERIASLRIQMRREKAKLEAFFRNASRRISFTRLCRKMDKDKHSTGYGVIEVTRDGRGEPSRMNYAPSWSFRAMPVEGECEVESRVRATDISYYNVREYARFRRFVQIYEMSRRFFKEFGDRRVMSAMTGQYYKDVKSLKREEGEDAREATELLWFTVDSPESDVYGLVVWSGCVPGVIGNREQAEVNLLFFRSKAIPPMVIMVSGGKLAKGSRERLEALIQNEIKGVENFHKILVIEAEPAGKGIGGAAGLPTQDKIKIELRPLVEAIWKDSLWQGYAEANKHDLGQSFRIPPMLRGDTEKLNRATAKIAKETAEQQVFAPERKDFEFEMDRTILTDLGIMLWTFKLNSPEQTDAEQLVDFITKLIEGALTVNEARRIIAKVFGMELPPLDADWARMPMRQSLAGLAPEQLPEDAEDSDDEAKVDQTTDESEVLKLVVPHDEFHELFETTP
jgi:PBSX family phage portal protein